MNLPGREGSHTGAALHDLHSPSNPPIAPPHTFSADESFSARKSPDVCSCHSSKQFLPLVHCTFDFVCHCSLQPHGGAVVRTLASEQEGPWLSLVPGLYVCLWVLSRCSCLPAEVR